ncbi:putative aryl-alcohol dehydrogenase [Moniliophthora roreri]|nr:putative aryl-alcohol dehydrogenase [Moniliophthora roreri]
MQKVTYIFPIIGSRKVEHLKPNIEALDIILSDEQIKYLESQLPFDIGFLMNLIVHDLFLGDGSEPTFQMKTIANFQKVLHPKALGAPQLPPN